MTWFGVTDHDCHRHCDSHRNIPPCLIGKLGVKHGYARLSLDYIFANLLANGIPNPTTNGHGATTATDRNYEVFRRQASFFRTRTSQFFRRTSDTTLLSEGTIVTVDCNPLPTGLVYHSPSQVGGWDLIPSQTELFGFWDHIKSWGGLWMWEMIFPDVGLGFDVAWMVSALRAGNLVCVTDGSYDRQRSPRVCAAGWIIMDTVTGSRLAGSFSEYSTSASSYRGELLGLCAINVILLALTVVGKIDNKPQVTVWCDNRGAVNRASDSSRRIKCGRPCADILRLLRSIRQELPLSTSFIHVKAHMDDTLSWEQLSLEQQLNCQCDTLAKAAVSRSLEHDHAHTSIGQLLPRESVGLYVQNRKITSDPANELRYLLGKMEAKRFLTMEQGWTEDMFEDTGWDGSTKFLPANQSCSDCGLANNTQTSAPLVYKL